MKSKGRPGPIRTNLAQRRPDKNPIFGIRAFLLLPGVLWLIVKRCHVVRTRERKVSEGAGRQFVWKKDVGHGR